MPNALKRKVSSVLQIGDGRVEQNSKESNVSVVCKRASWGASQDKGKNENRNGLKSECLQLNRPAYAEAV